MSTTERRHWGKAGERITAEEARKRRLPLAKAKALNKPYRDRYLDEAYRMWRAGGFCPDAATIWLDAKGLYGPEVDRACGVEEPAVDLWEAGKLYPTWEQLSALAELVGCTPKLLCSPPLDWRETSMRFHVPPHRLAEEPPPVLRCDLEAIHAVVLTAPERRPAEQ